MSTKKDVLFLILAIAVSFFLIPFVVFWLGYFIGWISTIVCGNALVRGINAFGFNITIDQIPAIGGALAWVGAMLFSKKQMEIKGDK